MSGRRVAVGLAAGFTIWGSALIVAYAIHAVGCAFDWPVGWLRVALAAILVAHGAAVAGLLVFRHPGSDPLAASVARWTMIAAVVAIILTVAPGLLLTTCV